MMNNPFIGKDGWGCGGYQLRGMMQQSFDPIMQIGHLQSLDPMMHMGQQSSDLQNQWGYFGQERITKKALQEKPYCSYCGSRRNKKRIENDKSCKGCGATKVEFK